MDKCRHILETFPIGTLEDDHLRRARALYHQLGLSDLGFKTIHVVGTNGKGSVTEMLSSALEMEGYRVGKFISPHLLHWEERITVNKQPIRDVVMREHLDRLHKSLSVSAPKNRYFQTFFFFALLYFQEQKVDYAVIEAGIGARNDVTSIPPHQLSIITTIGDDHADLIENIPLEKSGAVRPHTPCVIGEKAWVTEVFQAAFCLKAPLSLSQTATTDFVKYNRQIVTDAMRYLPLSEEVFKKCLLSLPKGRLELYTQAQLPPILFDAAHNLEAMEALIEKLAQEYPDKRWWLICGMKKTKQVEEILQRLADVAYHLVLLPQKDATFADPYDYTKVISPCITVTVPESMDQIQVLIEKEMAPDKDLAIFCGSFYHYETFGELRDRLATGSVN